VARLLLLTQPPAVSTDVLPALDLLGHEVRTLSPEPAALVGAPEADVVLVDGRRALGAARSLCQLLRTTGVTAPVLVVLSEGGFAALTAQWQVDDVVVDTAGPAEVEARIRLVTTRTLAPADEPGAPITAGDLVIDEAAYAARLRGASLDLTYKEFELLKYLAQHPGRVFSRDQLLQEVWGYDYLGGTRTVDVHVRRLRAKLGPEHEALIGTVRNVGYRFVPGDQRERTEVPATS
jgi:DNA-binding response OmpR family regulator